jgi:hypothetical protein
MGYAYANPGGRRDNEQDQKQNKSYDQEARREEIRTQRYRAPAPSESSISRNTNPPPKYDGPPRRNGKMSPEERRALRRQINEAGQTIY